MARIDGTIRGASECIAMTTDKTIIVPGHGPIGNRAQLIEFRDMLVAIRGNVAELKAKGLSLDDIIKAKPTAAFDAKWGQFVVGPALFTRIAYEGFDRQPLSRCFDELGASWGVLKV